MTNPNENQIESKAWSTYQWGVVFVLFLAMLTAFMDRVNLSVVMPVWIKQYHLAPAVAGLLASVFNWTYTASLLFSGPLVDKMKPKRIFPIGTGLWALATFITGLTVQLPVLVASRALLGVGEAALIPSASRIISETFEKKDRAKAVGIYFSGNKVGLTIGAPLAAIILAASDWHWVFYITGILSACWLIFWFAIYRPNKVLAKSANEGALEEKSSITWRQLLTYRSTWALMLGQAGYLYIFYVFVTWLPSYFVLQLKMTALKSGFTSMLPFLVSVISTIFGGWLADRWIKNGGNLTMVRKTFVCGGLALATVFVIIAGYSTTSASAITFLILSMAFLGFTTASVNTLPIDLAPRNIISSLTSLQNFGGNIGGAMAPIVTGILLGATHDFKIPLLVTGLVALVVGAGSYMFLLGKVQTMTIKEKPAIPPGNDIKSVRN